MNFRPKHERLLREIYKRDGTLNDQKLSFFKHYLQQKPMKIAETMGVLKEYSKKYAQNKSEKKYLTTLTISSHLIQDYAVFCTSFEISALKLIKTHLKEILKMFSQETWREYVPRCQEEIVKCFHFFTYAGTRSSRAEKISTHIFLALCTAIDGGFTAQRREKLTFDQLHENLAQIFTNRLNTFSSLHIGEAGEADALPGREDESYSTEESMSYNYPEGSNCTDKSSSSSFFSHLNEPAQPAQLESVPSTSNTGIISGSFNGNNTITANNTANSTPTQPLQLSATATPNASMLVRKDNAWDGHTQSQSSFSLTLRTAIPLRFICSSLFVVHPDASTVAETDRFLLSLLAVLIRSAGLLIHHTEKKTQSLNQTLLKAGSFNEDMRQEIFTTYFQMLSPTATPIAVRQAIEIASIREIPDIHLILYSTVSAELSSDLIIQSNVLLTTYRTKIFEENAAEKNRIIAAFLLLQVSIFIGTVQISIPPARMTKSFYFLLRSLYPKRSLFRKINLTEMDLQDRMVSIRYFKLFISRCQDKEIVFLSLLRRAFQKEAGIGSSSVPSDLKLLIAKEQEHALAEVTQCSCFGLFELLLDIAASPLLQFREQISSALIIMIEKGILTKRSQFEEHKRKRVFARIRTLAVKHGGLYVNLLKKSLPTINRSEIRVVAGVFSVINEVSGLEECGKYVDISEDMAYDIEEDKRLCNKESSMQGSSVRSGTTFGGVRKSSIRLFEIFKRFNK